MAITVPDVANIADGGHTTDHNTIRTALLALDTKDTNLGVSNVKDYGAVGDGVTDDTAAIVAANNAASRRVLFPAGTYKVTGLTQALADRTWVLDSGATIKLANSTNANVITVTGSNFTLTGGTVDGNRANQSATCYGVALSSSSGSTIKDVKIKDCYTNGVWGDAVTNAVVDGCSVTNCGQNINQMGIYFYYTSGASVGVRVTNNYIDGSTCNAGGIGFAAVGYQISRGVISGNTIIVGDAGATATLGIEMFSSTTGGVVDTTITNNVIVAENNTNATCYGISCGGSANSGYGHRNITISGNSIRNTRIIGIEAIGNNITVSGNTLQGTGRVAVYAGDVAGGSKGFSITGNTIVSPADATYALLLSATSGSSLNDVSVVGNSVTGFTGAELINITGAVGRVTISGNVFVGTGFGFTTAASSVVTDLLFSDNEIDCTGSGATRDGIYFGGTSVTRAVMTGNRVRGAGREGLWFNCPVTDLLFSGNQMIGNTAAGFQVGGSSSSNFLITGNTFTDNGGWGWLALATVTDLMIYGNRYESNTSGNETIGTSTLNSVRLRGSATTSAPAAGAGSALPATPQGYLTINVNNTDRQIAYY